MKNNHYGCENAASASIKVADFAYGKTINHFFGTLENAHDWLDKMSELNSKGAFSLHYYEVYERKGNKWCEVEW